ncbi:MAG: DUF3570 domain-containing protein [Deltaproteobacteria bacterium]|nr:DUF3570 domain-containing protein [Deltaproteobacteria bacterium]
MKRHLARFLALALSILLAGAASADSLKTQVNGFADDAANYIVTGAMKYENEFHDHYMLGAKAVVDGISSATPQSRYHDKTVTGLSGASREERRNKLGGFVGGYNAGTKTGLFEDTPDISGKRRVELSAFGSAEIDETTLGGGYMYSSEKNYLSNTLYGTLAQNFAMRNTTLAATYFHNFDTVETDNADIAQAEDFPKPKDVDGVNLGLTQVLSRGTIAQVVGSAILQRGALGDPERDMDVEYDGDVWRLDIERLPHRRSRYAVSARAIQALWTGSALEGGYRYYTDDWGIRSHTMLGEWRQYLAPWALLKLHGRFYTQSESDYTTMTARNGVDEFYTAAPVMQKFSSTLIGARIALIDHGNAIKGTHLTGGVGADDYRQTSREAVEDGYHAVIGRAYLAFAW